MNFTCFNYLDSTPDESLRLNRGFLFGDGFFTTGLVNQGKVENLTAHRERLAVSASKLLFHSFDLDLLESYLLQAVNNIEKAVFRLTVTRAQSARGYKPSLAYESEVLLQLFPLPPIVEGYCELKFSKIPATINPALSGIKHLNRLENVLAAAEVEAENQEVLLLANENIIGGSRTNLFVLCNGIWLTPELSNSGISGLTRKRLLTAMERQNINFKVCKIDQATVMSCQAACVTNSIVGVWPVSKIENISLDPELAENLKSSTLSIMADY